MLKSITAITLPKNFFSGGYNNYKDGEDKSVIKKHIFEYDPKLNGSDIDNGIFEPKHNVQDILNDKNISFYVDLNVRKYLMLDNPIKSGKIQGLDCDYQIFSNYDIESRGFIKISDIFNMTTITAIDAHNYNNVINEITKFIEFDLITTSDYLQLPYSVYGSWARSADWLHWSNFNKDAILTKATMPLPENKSVIHLKEILPFSNNKPLLKDDIIKVDRLLNSRETTKLGISLLNTMNPGTSFIEIMCTTNRIKHQYLQGLTIPKLPLIYGAYDIDPLIIRRVDDICKLYEENIGKLDDLTLEKIADNYYSPRAEKSSIFDFKLKVKRKTL